jgi:tRNA-2-methylthio-N6-dimethylallyladenosine synthase
MNVYIKTYGCQMNERDSQDVAAKLVQRGYCLVGQEADADIILLNTCSVRDQAEQKAIGKAGHLLKQKYRKPHLLVGIMGCMAQNRGEGLLDSLPDLDLIIGTQKFHTVPDHLDSLVQALKSRGPRPTTVVDLEDEAGSQNTIKDHVLGGKPTAFVSIMQGCNMNCAYCIVPATRGQERSRPMEDILQEVRQLAEGGTREITLLGQIVTSYGRRSMPFQDGKSPFVQLIEAVAAVPGIARVRFTSPHPCGFKQDLIDAYARVPQLCPQVHLPLQSGSDRILRAMNRPYTVERFCQIAQALRRTAPGICLSTDIIVGFPGETEEDFEATRQVFDSLAFEMAYLFKYSPRPGTVAEQMADDVPLAVKEARNQVLLDSLGRHSLRCNDAFVGSVQEVLVEEPAKRGEGLLMGRNPQARKVVFAAPMHRIGQLVPVRIQRATVSTLIGELA